jgi:hypothetical protein
MRSNVRGHCLDQGAPAGRRCLGHGGGPQAEPEFPESVEVGGYTATRLGGVWVFSIPPPANRPDGRMMGLPSVVNNCLTVGTRVVVWHETVLDEVADLVELAKSGATIEIHIGGSGLRDPEAVSSRPPNEPAPPYIPAVIGEKCAPIGDPVIWAASTGPLFD